jgi:hypothetical protein
MHAKQPAALLIGLLLLVPSLSSASGPDDCHGRHHYRSHAPFGYYGGPCPDRYSGYQTRVYSSPFFYRSGFGWNSPRFDWYQSSRPVFATRYVVWKTPPRYSRRTYHQVTYKSAGSWNKRNHRYHHRSYR